MQFCCHVNFFRRTCDRCWLMFLPIWIVSLWLMNITASSHRNEKERDLSCKVFRKICCSELLCSFLITLDTCWNLVKSYCCQNAILVIIWMLLFDMLFAFSHGIRMCKPGGTIVYSTSTMSPPQNDGTVQRAISKMWEETNIDVVVQRTDTIANAFEEHVQFFKGCRFGQLIVPNLTANFGPTYFCKLKRVR